MKTIGIISCGELGAAFASVFLARGMHVVTTLEGRSTRTATNSRRSGLCEFSSLREVIQISDILLSVAHPDAAESVAERYIELSEQRRSASLFVDLNSAAPATIAQIANRFERSAIPFVDAALVGPASHLTTSSTLYLSGQHSQQVAECIGPDVRIKLLGSRAGEASGLKMLIGGMNKGLAALFIELGLAAEAMGSLTTFLNEYEASYPEVMRLVERMVPTYSRHAGRRRQEVRQLDGMIRSLGLEPSVAAGAHFVIEGVERMNPTSNETSEALIRQLATLRRHVGRPNGRIKT